VVNPFRLDWNFFRFPVGAVDVDLLVESQAVGGHEKVRRNEIAIVAVPPFLLGLWREGNAGNILTPGTRARQSIQLGQYNGRGNNDHHAQDQSEVAQEGALELGPEQIPIRIMQLNSIKLNSNPISILHEQQ